MPVNTTAVAYTGVALAKVGACLATFRFEDKSGPGAQEMVAALEVAGLPRW